MDGSIGYHKVVAGMGSMQRLTGVDYGIPVGFCPVFDVDNGLAGSVIHGRSHG